MTPQLIIFDWDGTLADSTHRIVSALGQTLKEQGFEVPTPGRIRELIGLSLDDALSALLPGVSERQLTHIVRRYRQLWALGSAAPNQLFDGARDCLEQLHRRGVLLAVATGKSRQGLERDLSGHRLGQLLAATRCADETAPKPSPDMLLDILGELEIAAEAALMVGDTSYDMAMAQAAGVPRIGVRSGVHDESRLLPFSPLEVIDSVESLAPWLDAARAE